MGSQADLAGALGSVESGQRGLGDRERVLCPAVTDVVGSQVAGGQSRPFTALARDHRPKQRFGTFWLATRVAGARQSETSPLAHLERPFFGDQVGECTLGAGEIATQLG